MFTDPFFFSGGSDVFPTELGMFVAGAMLVAVISVLFAGRGNEDRTRVRSVARYLGAIGLFTLFITLFAAFGAAFSLTDLVVNHQERYEVYGGGYESDAPYTGIFLPVGGSSGYDFTGDPTNNSNYSAAVASGLIAITTGLIFGFHARWRRRLMDGPHRDDESVVRVDRTYHYGRCFVAALVAAVALTGVGFGVFEIAAPGIAVGGNADVVRAEGISEVLSSGVLALAALMIFIRSWNSVVRVDLGSVTTRRKQ